MTQLHRMLLLCTTLCALSLQAALPLHAAPLPATDEPPRVRLTTNLGDIVLELDPAKAPNTVQNFLAYVNAGTYNGTVFHRVIPGFMIQGGGYTRDYALVATGKPIQNEAGNGLRNLSGTVAMARTDQPHSATSQFFINAADNGFLDFRSESARGWGYAVFGKVVEGMDVVRKIEQSPTTQRDLSPAPGIRPLPAADVPRSAIVIEKAVLEKSAGKTAPRRN